MDLSPRTERRLALIMSMPRQPGPALSHTSKRARDPVTQRHQNDADAHPNNSNGSGGDDDEDEAWLRGPGALERWTMSLAYNAEAEQMLQNVRDALRQVASHEAALSPTDCAALEAARAVPGPSSISARDRLQYCAQVLAHVGHIDSGAAEPETSSLKTAPTKTPSKQSKRAKLSKH